MVWYPSVEDIVCLNMLSLSMTSDKHPFKLLGSHKGIQAIIESVMKEEEKGLSYQAAYLMKALVNYHAFGGGNHRTAYATIYSFLERNGKRLRVSNWNEAYPFIKNIERRSIEEVRRWIEHGQKEDL